MTANIRLDEGAAELIAGPHQLACQRIDGVTGAPPTGFDGGIADSYVMRILEEVIRTAGEIAGVNMGIAMLVTEAARQLKLTDEQVEEAFEAARNELK